MTDTPDPVDSDETESATPPPDLGAAGRKALDAERKARRDAERRERDLQARIAELEAADLRRDVAAAKGLTTAQAARLQGSTREEMEADADELLDAFRPAGTAAGPPRRQPTERLTADGEPGEPDAKSLADRIIGRPI